MRYAKWKSILTICMAMLFMAPFVASAQDRCNAALKITGIDGPGTIFEGDTVTLKVSLGAGSIEDGDNPDPYIDMTGFGFGLDCGGGEMDALGECTAAGHTIIWHGVTYTNCKTPTGDPAFDTLESDNIVSVPVIGIPPDNVLRHAVGESCEVHLEYELESLSDSTNWVDQAVGIPYGAMEGTCSNGLMASSYGTAAYEVATCDIDVVKEVSLDNEVWYDANSEEAALLVGNAETLYYRVKVVNEGTAPLVGDVRVSDSELGIDKDYALGGEGIIELGSFDIASKCEELYGQGERLFTNEASVEGFCRLEDGDISAVSDTESDIANVLCPTPEPEIDVQKEIFDGEKWVEYNGPVDAPSGALYRITVKNTGGINLKDVVIEDSMISATPFPIGDLAMGETVVIKASGDDADMIWTALDVAEVCAEDEIGEYENWITATGYSVFDGEETTDTDNATLECRGVPKISLIKEVSLTGGAPWFDAETPEDPTDPPLPTANVGEGDDAVYRLTVGNIGTATLENVTVNDAKLGLVNFLVGTMAPGDVVVLEHGELFGDTTMKLIWPDICDSTGQKTNVAYVSGEDEFEREDNDSDAATVDCIGEPAIQVVKEVSVDGTNWSAVVDAPAPANAYYRVTVKNIGTVDLQDVAIDDELLGIDGYLVGADGELLVGETVEITSGELEAIIGYVPQSCDTTETIDNTVVAEGFYENDGLMRVFDDSDAQLNCFEAPEISVIKEVSLDDGTTWFDANLPDGPLPYALVGGGDDAIYRITVENVGSVTLYDVVVNDDKLGLVDFPVGTMAAGDVVVLEDGEMFGQTAMELVWPAICDSTEFMTNTASAGGADTFGRPASDSDSATVDCIEVDIQVVKEVSVDGSSWSTVVNTVAPANAYYRITVTNLSSVDLQGVVIDDALLGIDGYLVGGDGELLVGETIVITSGELEAIDGYVPQSCNTTETIDNTVFAEGSYGDELTTDEASAQLNCEEPANICDDFGRPANLYFKYTYQTGNDNSQAQGSYASPDDLLPAEFPEYLIIEIYDTRGPYLMRTMNVTKGSNELIPVLGAESSKQDGKVPPNIVFMLWRGDDENDLTYEQSDFVQEVGFHGSCSEPLIPGEQFGGTTLVDFDPVGGEAAAASSIILLKDELNGNGKKGKGGK